MKLILETLWKPSCHPRARWIVWPVFLYIMLVLIASLGGWS